MELMSKLVIDPPRILLAPMEGVMESVMRDMLTRIGGYERCVTEFVRVSSTVLPPKVYYRLCPEQKREDEQLPVLSVRSVAGFRSRLDGGERRGGCQTGCAGNRP